MVTVGGLAAFSVTATGDPLNYQWFLNGNPVAGATASNYSIGNVVLTNTGGYFAILSNQFNSVTSSVANLVVGNPPQTIRCMVTANGLPEILMPGTPGFNYVLQTTTNLQPPVPWQTVASIQADSNGVCAYVDTNGLSSDALFYRMSAP
jgi:hypothetical protein